MITELHGLKVKAIAVEVPLQYEYNVVSNVLHLWLEHLSTWGREIVLPPGEWKILGRVGDAFDQAKIIENLYQTTDRLFGWAQWHKYCAKHGLTNEPILISNE